MRKRTVSWKLSRWRPRPCFEPTLRAAKPWRPSRTTPAMTREEASSHRRSITYVIATKPTIAFTIVMTSAIETLRTQPQSIRHLRDRGRPRPHAVPRRDRRPAPRRQDEVDPRPEPHETDALALLDLIPDVDVGDDPAGERPPDLGEPEGAEAGLQGPPEPPLSGGPPPRRDRRAPRAGGLARDGAPQGGAGPAGIPGAPEKRGAP